jgi:hypothetical protein
LQADTNCLLAKMLDTEQCLPNLVQCGMHQIEAVDGIQQIVVGTIQ